MNHRSSSVTPLQNTHFVVSRGNWLCRLNLYEGRVNFQALNSSSCMHMNESEPCSVVHWTCKVYYHVGISQNVCN